MSLDQNLFTLHFAPSKNDPSVTDLVDPSNNAHYRKVRVLGTVYRIDVYDPLSESLLATATAPSATSKHKTIELHNPSKVVELKYTGTLMWKWRFQWEEHEFEWRREECFILRKPDPAVLVAVTKDVAGRLKTTSVQILDYNLNRFDIEDRKGLEIVLLTALLTFQDTNDAFHTPSGDATPTAQDANPTVPAVSPPSSSFFGISRRVSEGKPEPSKSLENVAAPPLPPKPEPRTGVDRVTEMHTIRAAQGEGEANEVQVGVEAQVDDYASYADKLLRDEAILFVTIRSASAAEVPKVLQVVEQIKRMRHQAGLDDDEELHQYVVYDTAKAKGPRRIINLDDPNPNTKTYTPPSSLSVHLSKIDMPELQPKPDLRAPERLSLRPPLAAPVVRAHSEMRGKKDEQRLQREREAERVREQEREREKERDRERAKELERMKVKQLELEKARQKEQEKARKKAEKDAKKAGKSKTNNTPQQSPPMKPQFQAQPPPQSRPQPNLLTRPEHSTGFPETPIVQTIPVTPSFTSAFQSPYQSSYSSYQPPPSPSFPQPGAASSYYGGEIFSSVGTQPPPTHPSTASNRTRPMSFYGDSSGYSGPYNPGYLRQ